MICFVLVAAFATALPGLAQAPSFQIDSLAGGDSDSSSSTTISFDDIRGITIDLSGNVYVADATRSRVYKITPNGALAAFAGTGSAGFSGDSGPALSAQLNTPYGLAADSAGNVYIADLGNSRVRRVSPDGRIQTVAGGGRVLPISAGVTAAEVALKAPRNVALDSSRNLYISDFSDHRVLKVTPGGLVSVVVGTGAAGPATDTSTASATLNYPTGLFVEANGTLWIADSANHVVRRVSGLSVTTFRFQTSENYINLPTGVLVDAAGNVYVTSSGFDHLARISASGVATVLTTGVREAAFDPAGTIVAASMTLLKKQGSGGQWTPIIGAGAQASSLAAPTDVKVDPQGSLLVADTQANRVLRISPAGVTTSLAGTGTAGFSGDNAPATAAALASPQGAAADSGSAVYISDTENHRIRKVDSSGVIRTVAGTGTAGITADVRQASLAMLRQPGSVVVDRLGDVYFSETGNHMIRRLATNGFLYPVAGNGQRGFRGDGGVGPAALLDTPRGVAMDGAGNLYVADSGNHRIRKVTLQGVISTVAGNGTAGFSGDGQAALNASLNQPSGVAFDANGNLYIADTGNHRVRFVGSDGVIQTVAGTGVKGFAGDKGAALSARLDTPTGVSVDSTGAIYIADRGNARIRKLTASVVPPVLNDSTGLRILHAATLVTGSVAPGMLVVLTGSAIGPPAPVTARPGVGNLETALSGTQVRFDGQAAPLLYAQNNMIHAQVPYSVAQKSASVVEVMRDGLVKAQATVSVAPLAPGIFTTASGSGPAAAVNEDQSLNSELAPAARGGQLTVFLTGEGALAPALVEGRLSDAPYPTPQQPIQVQVGGQPATLVSAAGAMTLPGLLQVTVRVPSQVSAGAQTLAVTIGNSAAQPGVTVYVK